MGAKLEGGGRVFLLFPAHSSGARSIVKATSGHLVNGAAVSVTTLGELALSLHSHLAPELAGSTGDRPPLSPGSLALEAHLSPLPPPPPSSWAQAGAPHMWEQASDLQSF